MAAVSQSPAAPPQAADDKLDYIDAVRGWAILLVITVHAFGTLKQTPWPVRRITDFGWHGVQLFFLASAVTLLLSWQRSAGPTRMRDFFIRRFLRIAPLYYLGAIIYFVARPPATGFDLGQLLATLFFVNSWHPDWIPTTPGWMVVPGGWSIGVEFTFYFLFPVIAALVTSFRRALVFLAVTIAVALVGNYVGGIVFGDYPSAAVSNFLFFWFPNQFPIFGLGFVLFFLLRAGPARIGRGAAYAWLAVAFLTCAIAIYFPSAGAHYFTLLGPPNLLIASIGFSFFIYALAKGPPTLFTHPMVRWVGVLSFAAYVLHFLAIDIVMAVFGRWVDFSATGFGAVGAGIFLWVMTVGLTLILAALAHRFIEQPGIRLSRQLVRRGRPVATERALAAS